MLEVLEHYGMREQATCASGFSQLLAEADNGGTREQITLAIMYVEGIIVPKV